MTLGGANSDSVAQDRIKAFVERIMRMREEAKAINDDIREIYAEAKTNGFDKTVLGKLVLYVEKRGKDKASVAEADALFDLYLEAFDGRPSRTHAHEGDKTNSQPPGGPTAGEGSDALPADTSLQEMQTSSPQPHRVMSMTPLEARQAGDLKGFGFTVRFDDAPPADTPTGAAAILARRPWCLHAHNTNKCGGYGKQHCGPCLKAHADDVGETA